jgi:hypothetical protein
LANRTCSHDKWKSCHWPCSHVLTCCAERHHDIT